MDLLNQLTIRSLKLNRKRTIVTIIGIILSVAMLTAVSSLYFSGVQSLIDYQKTTKGDYHVSFKGVKAEDMPSFWQNRSLKKINVLSDIGYSEIASKNEYKPYAFVMGFSKSALEDMAPRLVSGRMPQNSNEIVIPSHLKTNGRLTIEVGTTLTLKIGQRVTGEGLELFQGNPFYHENNEKIINTHEQTFVVVGIVERPTTAIENYEAPGYTFITLINDDEMGRYNDVYVTLTDEARSNYLNVTAGILGVDAEAFKALHDGIHLSEEQYQKYLEEISKARYMYGINYNLLILETSPLEAGEIRFLSTAVIFVLVIIVISSVYCIKNSFEISIVEKTRQYGMLRSVGATRKQIRRNVFYEAGILAAIGLPLGVLSGYFASYVLVIVTNALLVNSGVVDLHLKFNFSFASCLAAILLGLLTVFLSSFRSAYRASRISPIDSIRNSGEIKIKHYKTPGLIQKMFGMGGQIAYKNMKRNRRKYRTAIISIIVSTVTFITVSSFATMLSDNVKNLVDENEANMVLTVSNVDANLWEKLKELPDLPAADRCSVLRRNALALPKDCFSQEYLEFTKADKYRTDEYDEYVEIMAVGEKEYRNYLQQLGVDYQTGKDGLILSDMVRVGKDNGKGDYIYRLMKMYKYKTGDSITLTDGNTVKATMKVLAESADKPFGYPYRSDTISGAVISDEMYDKLFTTSDVRVSFRTGNTEELQKEIEQFLGDGVYNLRNLEQENRQSRSLVLLVNIFLYGFITVISLIGITNIINTLNTGMELKKREFATLKSVGMTSREFNRMISLESIFMAAKALIIALPLGIGGSVFLYFLIGRDEGFAYHPPVVSVISSIVVVFGIVYLIMKMAIKRIDRQNIIETIRNENI